MIAVRDGLFIASGPLAVIGTVAFMSWIWPKLVEIIRFRLYTDNLGLNSDRMVMISFDLPKEWCNEWGGLREGFKARVHRPEDTHGDMKMYVSTVYNVALSSYGDECLIMDGKLYTTMQALHLRILCRDFRKVALMVLVSPTPGREVYQVRAEQRSKWRPVDEESNEYFTIMALRDL